MARATREEWAKRIERWVDSGLTAREFAAETGLNVNSLKCWRWRLRARSKQPSAKPSAPKAGSFVEVVAPLIASPAGEPSNEYYHSGNTSQGDVKNYANDNDPTPKAG